MKDAEYLFKQTERERKRIGRGDFNRKRQGGKQVRFPSDHLTKKEREAMNGEVVSYQLGKPTDWATLKSWPEEIQKVYLTGLRKTYGVGGKEIGEMLGVAKVTVCHHEKKLGVSAPIGKRTSLRREEWAKFLGRKVEPVEAEAAADPEPEAVEEPAPEEKETPTCPQLDDIMKIAEFLLSIKATGAKAKVTVEITL